jgi:photoactive yellow protein
MASSGALPVEDLSTAEPGLLDRLPFGVVRTRGDGRILSYSRGESAYSKLDPARVIGKNFFRQVAPCTRVQEFEGWLEKMQLAKTNGRATFGFVFKFPHGAILMRIVITYEAANDICTILMKPEAEDGVAR